MKILPRILTALLISAALAAVLSTILGRVLFLSSRSEVITLAATIFVIAVAVTLPLIAFRRGK